MTDTTSKGFPIHDAAAAPEGSRAMLERSRAQHGAVPNLHAILAESPAALVGYRQLWALMEGSSLTPAERQVVYLTSSYENECRYCMAGHTVLARHDGLPEDAIGALRGGTPIPDGRLEALRRFTSQLVTQRGWVAEDEVARFLGAGFTRAQVLEVVLGVATKVISDYTNHLADTPLDGFMADTVWAPPREAAA